MIVEDETRFDSLKLRNGFNPFLPTKLAHDILKKVHAISMAERTVDTIREQFGDDVFELEAVTPAEAHALRMSKPTLDDMRQELFQLRTQFINAAHEAKYDRKDALVPFIALEEAIGSYLNNQKEEYGYRKVFDAINTLDAIALDVWNVDQGRKPLPRVRCEESDLSIWVDGKRWVSGVAAEIFAYFKILVDRFPSRISFSEMKAASVELQAENQYRLKKKIDKCRKLSGLREVNSSGHILKHPE